MDVTLSGVENVVGGQLPTVPQLTLVKSQVQLQKEQPK